MEEGQPIDNECVFGGFCHSFILLLILLRKEWIMTRSANMLIRGCNLPALATLRNVIADDEGEDKEEEEDVPVLQPFVSMRAFNMRNKNRTKAVLEPIISRAVENPDVPLQPQLCFDGENLATLLKSFQREIESARALDAVLPHKFSIKQQFSVGVNEVTRLLERMPPHHLTKLSSEEFSSTKLDSSKAHSVHLQAVLLASDCNPRWLTKHLPALAASRNVPLILIKDSKRGSLRLGELIKLKTAIAIGVKAKGNNINQLIKDILLGDKIHDRIEI